MCADRLGANTLREADPAGESYPTLYGKLPKEGVRTHPRDLHSRLKFTSPIRSRIPGVLLKVES